MLNNNRLISKGLVFFYTPVDQSVVLNLRENHAYNLIYYMDKCILLEIKTLI